VSTEQTSSEPGGDDMATAYDARATESRWYATWLDRGYFGASPDSDREPFSIVLPPPNVTGALHIGHALEHVEHDIVVRRKRMQGYEALWVPGTDHAGIATQVVVERELAKEGVDRRTIGRDAFIERVWEWKQRYGGRIVEQMQALGDSCDWDRLRFTMDDGLAHAVRVAFVRLYDAELIYRGERLVNWCPRDTTALSDSEVEHEDVAGELVTLRYPLADGSGHVDVATTRVETMLGDTGIAVHPDDERYAALVGRTVRHPFRGDELPIVADAAVDPAFGTGAVKVTPAHDPTDFDIGQRHGLGMLNVLTAEAHLADTVPEPFRGLDRMEARRAVREELDRLGLVVAKERPYVHSVGRCYRCHTEIEPWISGLQWFVKVYPLKGPAMDAARSGAITFHPAKWIHQYLEWMEGLRDWNISRQLWWGHRIPVWYCPDGHETAAVEDPDACATCGSKEIEQDPDVLDTWFSSQLWPFSTLGWPDETPDLAFFHPTSLLITGYEILYLWVARMIMSGLFLTGEVPFRNVVIHGLVRDPQGRKMSKSTGNIIDPLEVIERVGADPLRFGLAWQATEAQNIPFGEEHIDAGRRFANKVWNASRLVLGAHTGGAPVLPPLASLTLPERWLLSRYESCLAEVDEALDQFRFSDAAQAVHRFVWSEFCDWGLEMEKGALAEEGPARDHAGAVLAWVLERSLRILHPIMPFVTEEIWQRFEAGPSIVVAPWPERHEEHLFSDEPGVEGGFRVLRDLITRIRQARSDYDIPPGTALRLLVPAGPLHLLIDEYGEAVRRMAGLSGIEASDGDPGRRGVVRLPVEASEVLLDAGDAFDPDAARARIQRKLVGIEADADKGRAKLANPSFVERAPAEVRQKVESQVEDAERQAAALRERLAALG
jgi:valyl-tRNA synthetase